LKSAGWTKTPAPTASLPLAKHSTACNIQKARVVWKHTGFCSTCRNVSRGNNSSKQEAQYWLAAPDIQTPISLQWGNQARECMSTVTISTSNLRYLCDHSSTLFQVTIKILQLKRANAVTMAFEVMIRHYWRKECAKYSVKTFSD